MSTEIINQEPRASDIDDSKVIKSQTVRTWEHDYVKKIFDGSNLSPKKGPVYYYDKNDFFNNRNGYLLRPHPNISGYTSPAAGDVISKNNLVNYFFSIFILYTNFREVRWSLIDRNDGHIGTEYVGYGYFYDDNICARKSNHILNNLNENSRFVITTKEDFLAKLNSTCRNNLNAAIDAIVVANINCPVKKSQIETLLQRFIEANAYITKTYYLLFTEQDRTDPEARLTIKYHLTRDAGSPIRYVNGNDPEKIFPGDNYNLKTKSILATKSDGTANDHYTMFMTVPGNFAGWNQSPGQTTVGKYNNGYKEFTLNENARIYPYHNLELYPAYKTFLKITYCLGHVGKYLNQNINDFYDEVHLNGSTFDAKVRDDIPIGTTWTTRGYKGSNNHNDPLYGPSKSLTFSRVITQATDKGYVVSLVGWTTDPNSNNVSYDKGATITNMKNHITLYPVVKVVKKISAYPYVNVVSRGGGIGTSAKSVKSIIGKDYWEKLERENKVICGFYFSDGFKVPKDLSHRVHLKCYYAGKEVISDAQDPKYAKKGRCSSSGDGTIACSVTYMGITYSREKIRDGMERLGLDGNHVYTAQSIGKIQASDQVWYHADSPIFSDGASIDRIAYIDFEKSVETTTVVA